MWATTSRHFAWVSAGCLLVSTGLLASSCATEQFQYVPSEHQAANSRVKDEAVYSVPKDSPNPNGSVRIISDGIKDDLKVAERSKSISALHLKMAITNKKEMGVWTLDARDLSVSFPNTAQVHPVVIQSGSTIDTRIDVNPGELRTVDLYFPLPMEIRSSDDLPEFDFHWQMHSVEELVDETTLFDRVYEPEYSVVYPNAFYPYYYGIGPRWYGGATVMVP